MAEEKTEETIENPEEAETSEEETVEEEQEIPEKPEKPSEELEEKNKRLYARMKKAEEDAKSAKDELEQERKKPFEAPANVFDLAKTVSTLKDYNPEELDFIQMMSKAKSISPEEAAKTEEAKLYISARRQKVEAEKSTPEPSTKQSPSKKPIDKITPDDVSKMGQKDKEDYLRETGWLKTPRKSPRER